MAALRSDGGKLLLNVHAVSGEKWSNACTLYTFVRIIKNTSFRVPFWNNGTDGIHSPVQSGHNMAQKPLVADLNYWREYIHWWEAADESLTIEEQFAILLAPLLPQDHDFSLQGNNMRRTLCRMI